MPLRLATVDEARDWLRLPHHADDEKIDTMLQASSQAVVDYLDLTWVEDSDGEYTFTHGTGDDEAVVEVGMPERVAALMLVLRIFDGTSMTDEYGRLPADVTSLLYVRRRNLGIA